METPTTSPSSSGGPSESVNNLMQKATEMKNRIQVCKPKFPLDEFMDEASKTELTMKWRMNLMKFMATLLQGVLENKVKSNEAAAIFVKFGQALATFSSLQPDVCEGESNH